MLSDGSSVHLNSGSILKFPGAFKKDQPREVFLEGEGFFRVSKINSTSFIVNSKTTSTKVLGTEFNVSSYTDSDKTEIVLVEGSVGVKIKEEDTYTLITPSQKASTSHKIKDLTITNVNIEKYIAWKEGSIVFQNDQFKTIKKILERHYNVKIVNNFMELEKFRYNGNFKNDSIEKILNTIKLHTNFSFIRKGDTISINKPNKNR
nr:FecR family protein [Gelidibacter salicanalis]